MKKISIALMLAITSSLSAQATRFVYQVSMKTDSTNRNDVATELAYLDATPQKSIFYAENRLKRDSMMQRMRATRDFNMRNMEGMRTKINYIVEKNLPAQEVTYQSRIGRDNYMYTEKQPMTWKILPETAKIGEYSAQKAEADYGGRHWTAWFTTDVPLNDGPYKFSGLPGLIIKAEDSKGDYSFDLMRTEKITAPHSFESFGQTVTVKKADFVKQEDKFRKDPMAAFNSGGVRFQPRDPSQMKQMQDRMKEMQQKNNNPIELKP
ncbi:MAG: GLPGLI family protein [Chryseobacterium sp.]|nr:MAG: GLPGLI family protein [Chryseobacterium sp.]